MKMNSVICTLYEGGYHFGVASLINSLHKHEFYGDVYIGYRGKLPFWANEAKVDSSITWEGAMNLQIASNLNLHFLPLVTEVHLTNYKPHFMLQVWDKCVKQIDIPGIFYFDPDIVIKCSWSFYENWISYGVALVHEIVWNDMPPTHPKRHQWMSVAHELGLSMKNKLQSQINAGFIGVNRNQLNFLGIWHQLIEHTAIKFGLDKTKLSQSINPHDIFYAGDQDLLNLTAMCTDESLSEMGPEGMDFINGGWTMSHAVGHPKPWQKKYILSAFKGNPPGKADRAFWVNAKSPLSCYSNNQIKMKRLSIAIAALIGRFYKRN